LKAVRSARCGGLRTLRAAHSRVDRIRGFAGGGAGDALAARLGNWLRSATGFGGRAAALAAIVDNGRGFDGRRGVVFAGQKRDARTRVLGGDIVGLADSRELELAFFDQLVPVDRPNSGPRAELGLEALGSAGRELVGNADGGGGHEPISCSSRLTRIFIE
jgi:hypothetical protein